MSAVRPTPEDILLLSVKQSYGRLAFWLRVNVWALVFSVPLVTWPAAQAGLYHAVREGLRDPFEAQVNPRQAFWQGFARHFKQGTALAVLNLLALIVIVLAILFWITRESLGLKFVAAIAISMWIFWWLCQAFLWPMLVEHPAASIWQVWRETIRLVLAKPVFALVVACAHTALTMMGLLLLGPSLLIVPSLIALISIQGLWAMTGVEIPDLADPVEYANRRNQPTERPVQ